MTICANDSYVVGGRFSLSLSRAYWQEMMDFNKPLSQIAVSLFKAKVTHLAPIPIAGLSRSYEFWVSNRDVNLSN